MPEFHPAQRDTFYAYGTFSVANTAALTDAITATLRANPEAGTFYRLTVGGQYLNNSGANKTLRLEIAFGGSAMYTATTGNLAASASTRSFKAEVHLFIPSTTSQRIVSEGVIANTATADGTATWANNNPRYLGERAVSVDMSTAQDLVVRFAHSAAATTVTIDGNYRIERIVP